MNLTQLIILTVLAVLLAGIAFTANVFAMGMAFSVIAVLLMFVSLVKYLNNL